MTTICKTHGTTIPNNSGLKNCCYCCGTKYFCECKFDTTEHLESLGQKRYDSE